MRSYAVLVLFFFACHQAFGQWTDTSNQFRDSLHMPVSQADGTQDHVFIVKSEDGGYFVVWQDTRATATNKTDIYAQKYDKNGKRLWAVDGMPIAEGPLDEEFAMPSNTDYRNYSYAATDGAGGLYACWSYQIQIGSYDYYGVAVQHLRADGSAVFAADGNKIAQPDGPTNTQYSSPELVSDGKNGFFIAYKRINNFNDVFAWCYKDEGGTLKNYGGGQMDEYGKQQISGSQCGDRYYIDAWDASVESFALYPDQQGGCNIAMTMTINSQQYYVGFNRLCRVKKDCHTTVLRRTGGDSPANTGITEKDYKKDSVVRLYSYTTYFYEVTCSGPPPGNDVYVVENYKIENNGYGFLPLNMDTKYFAGYPQGLILQTGGNINAELITTTERALDGAGGVTDYHIHGYSRVNEIYDSIPYQLCSDMDHPYVAYRPFLPDAALPSDSLTAAPDTLISRPSVYEYNYTLAGSGNKAWVTSQGNESGTGIVGVYLQELKLTSPSAHTYAFTLNTSDKTGLKIGQQVLTGFTGTEIYYNTPAVAVDNNGHGLFYVQEATRYVRVSPIEDGGKLSWGAMGKPVGTGYYALFPYSINYPSAVLDETGNGVVAWNDARHIAANINSADNIWMNRISHVFVPAYQPPLNTAKLLYPGIPNEAIPNFLAGTTGAWTTIQQSVNNPTAGGVTGFTPVVSLVDDYPLGFVDVYTWQNGSPIRSYNGKPYLDRNYTIHVGNNPNGTGNIHLRLYFTKTEFDALKAADPSISNPGDLGIVKQPNDNTGSQNVPGAYSPVAGEEQVMVSNWGAIDSGYYVELVVKGFSNFFIAKGVTPLPLTWLGIQAAWQDNTTARVQWQVAQVVNVKEYHVQHSTDGSNFTDETTIGDTSLSSYTALVPANPATRNFYRIEELDLDGRKTYSSIVALDALPSTSPTLYPNPAKDRIFVTGLGQYKSARVTDESGRILAAYTTVSDKDYFDTGHLPPGHYFLTLEGGGLKTTLSFIILK